MFNKKGQGTIEYLVIIAIVVVIALVVVGILLQILDQGSSIPTESAKIAWKSAEPWAIVDWSMSTGGNLTLVIQNNSHESLSLDEVVVDGDSNTVDSSNVAAGATVTKVINTGDTRSAGDRYAYDTDIYFVYNTSNITGKKQFGAASIVGTAG